MARVQPSARTRSSSSGGVFAITTPSRSIALPIRSSDSAGHVYGYENGLDISALVAVADASRNSAALDAARRAADAIFATHVDADGSVRHDATTARPVRFLADAASVGRALVRLFRATGESRYEVAATNISAWMTRALLDPENGAFFEHTPDADAAGVFTRRRHPFRYNVLAARFLSDLSAAIGEP